MAKTCVPAGRGVQELNHRLRPTTSAVRSYACHKAHVASTTLPLIYLASSVSFIGNSSVRRHRLARRNISLPFSSNSNSTKRVILAPAPAAAIAMPAATAITADPWQTLAVLSTCAAASQLLESHTEWGALLSAPLLALMAALAAAAMGLLPAVSPVYDTVWRFLMPLAVALYMLENDFMSLVKSGRQVLLAFLLGSVTMMLGSWCAWKLLGSHMGQYGAQLACCLLASYIGGSVNFAAVAAATQLPTYLMPAAVAADNLAMLVLLAAMMVAPLQRIVATLYPTPALAAVAVSPKSSANPPDIPPDSSIHGAAATTKSASQPAASGALGADGQLLETPPPSATSVAACMEASALGRAATGSRSGSSRMRGGVSASANPKQHVRSRALGQLAFDGHQLLTPDPGAAILGSGNATAAAAAANKTSTAAARSRDTCGGCRASGVTALDDTPLLTQAPAMGDAISSISAARSGKQQLKTPVKPGSAASSSSSYGSGDSSSSSGSSDQYDSSSGVVGCGCCAQALDAMANPLPSAGQQAPVSGALDLKGGALMTEEPDSSRMAAAVAAAKTRSRSGSVSVSSSALSSLASTESVDELELVVKFNIYELQDRLKKKQQHQQQQPQVSAATPGSIIATGVRIDTGVRGTPPAVSTSSSSSVSAVLTSSSAAASLAAAAVACAASHQLSAWLGAPALQLLLLSCCAMGLSVGGNAAHKRLATHPAGSQPSSASLEVGAAAAAAAGSPFAGAMQLGQLLMGLFFATLGASCCCSWSSLVTTAPLVGFVMLMVIVHWALMAAVGSGRLLGGRMLLPLDVLMAGSVANVGGPATAAALATAKGWGQLVQPSLLCGSLGYALGTAGGLALARVLGVV